MSKKNRIRIYINCSLNVGEQIVCDEKQSHYLLNVMRLSVDDEVFVFNGKEGEFCCKVKECGKKKCVLESVSKLHDFEQSPDVWLLFAFVTHSP